MAGFDFPFHDLLRHMPGGDITGDGELGSLSRRHLVIPLDNILSLAHG